MNMMIKTLLAATALTASASASAATTFFNFTSAQFNLSFALDAPITPVTVSTGQYFQDSTTVATLNGAVATFGNLIFLNSAYSQNGGSGIHGGGFSYNSQFANFYYGAQLYSGTESAPVFIDGIYNLTNYQTGAVGVLTITSTGAVPEPATWGMMIAGFGMLGAAMRMRRRSTKVTFA